jgi:hypothetical protein
MRVSTTYFPFLELAGGGAFARLLYFEVIALGRLRPKVDRFNQQTEIEIGSREIGGVYPMMKAAAVAESAGLKICIHSSFTTGITTCAEHHIGLAIPNLDDGNQIMWQPVQKDIVATPSLAPEEGWLKAFKGPGLGFTLNRDLIAEGEGRFTATKCA